MKETILVRLANGEIITMTQQTDLAKKSKLTQEIVKDINNHIAKKEYDLVLAIMRNNEHCDQITFPVFRTPLYRHGPLVVDFQRGSIYGPLGLIGKIWEEGRGKFSKCYHMSLRQVLDRSAMDMSLMLDQNQLMKLMTPEEKQKNITE